MFGFGMMAAVLIFSIFGAVADIPCEKPYTTYFFGVGVIGLILTCLGV